MKITKQRKLTLFLYSCLGLLILAVLLLSGLTRSAVSGSRSDGTYRVIEAPARQTLAQADAPAGVVCEYRFSLDGLRPGDSLMLYSSHSDVAVSIGQEQVYCAVAADGLFRTSGCRWAIIPLHSGDEGQEVCIRLSPLYKNYEDTDVEFFIGGEGAIFRSVLHDAMPELLLSLCVVLTGLILLCLGAYYTGKQSMAMPRLYAVGLLSVSAGVWRFSYGSVPYLLFDGLEVLLYHLSVIALMVVGLSMLGCVTPAGEKQQKLLRWIGIGYCAADVCQLLLQLFGVLDLRQLLKLTHITIILSAAVLCFTSGKLRLRKLRQHDSSIKGDYSWILGIGVLIDLVLYYCSDASAGMLFTLGAILCFSLLEGVRLLVSFREQKNALREMEDQLTLSRTMTMASQIRSHFVFNILNAISGMCKYDPEKADDTIVRFARYLRTNIDIMQTDASMPFSAALEQLEDYVILEQIRFGDKLEFQQDIETDRFMIPPLILQPIVENAIKHGISKKIEGGTILLRTRDMGSHVRITVEDNGVGFDLSELDKEKSVGIKNIRFRLHHLVGGAMDIASQVGQGTTVTIIIPKEQS